LGVIWLSLTGVSVSRREKNYFQLFKDFTCIEFLKVLIFRVGNYATLKKGAINEIRE